LNLRWQVFETIGNNIAVKNQFYCFPCIVEIIPSSEQFPYHIVSNPEQFDIAHEAPTEPQLFKICFYKQVPLWAGFFRTFFEDDLRSPNGIDPTKNFSQCFLKIAQTPTGIAPTGHPVFRPTHYYTSAPEEHPVKHYLIKSTGNYPSNDLDLIEIINPL
jgi:hypothetical protein